MRTAHPAPVAPSALIRWLGGTTVPLPSPGPLGTILLGQLGALEVLQSDAGIGQALVAARKLARTGQPVLLIADDDGSARRLICVTVPPVRPLIVTPTEQEESLPLVRLRRVGAAGNRLELALAAAAALDVDAAGRRAFRALRDGMARVRSRLPLRLCHDTAHAWVLLQVTRLLFLRFVEAEGWLDGRADFLAQAIDDCLRTRRDPEPSLIAPLFFGTLNRPVQQRSRRALGFGKIPFLNGGLFEPHPMERHRRWRLDAEGWRELFALLVESFEVTLDRGDVGDRVNPELLGRVFEGTMAPDERKDAGAFYTPMPLVQGILLETVIEHLALRLGQPAARVRSRLADRDAEIGGVLMSLRILDPAVGSGAFLVAALELICGDGSATAAQVRRVITRQLHGVDTNPAAVRITELRLWLELLRTMRGRRATRVPPLPNLDTCMRTGNALIDPFAGHMVSRQLLRNIAAARSEAARLHGAERRSALVRLQRAERAGAIAVLESRLVSSLELMADLDIGSPRTDLFGAEHRPAVHMRERLRAIEREVGALRKELARLNRDPSAAVFGIEAAFGDITASGGFDLVVGNPPWIRAERLTARERELLSARYRWWRSSGHGWRHQPDLAVAFLERSFGLLRSGGTLGFLVPSKLATAGYALACRAELVHRSTIHVAAPRRSKGRLRGHHLSDGTDCQPERGGPRASGAAFTGRRRLGAAGGMAGSGGMAALVASIAAVGGAHGDLSAPGRSVPGIAGSEDRCQPRLPRSTRRAAPVHPSGDPGAGCATPSCRAECAPALARRLPWCSALHPPRASGETPGCIPVRAGITERPAAGPVVATVPNRHGHRTVASDLARHRTEAPDGATAGS
ncbi:MAG TPA: hypothetical protein PLL69_05220 [Gemmatimonadales bacterium]|nr:hypothetical protein [Gemmatimonadales bacterium]